MADLLRSEIPLAWVGWLAGIALLVGLGLILSGRRTRQSRGLSQGHTLDLDKRNFYSRRYGLAGRPDRLFRDGEATIPEEWKKARRVWPSHRAQLGAYLILIEEETGVRPPYGVILLGDVSRVRVENTPELRAWVLDVADQIRAARRQLAEIIHVNPRPGQCRACGMREVCGQSRV
jgi:CRISPR-associated exonuclease Cas4